jgi:DNA (cytosine-5)-methyltransferase 1
MTPSTRPTTGSAGLRYLSVCSGIEAATVAWRPLGWRAFAYSEIEPFPCAVLEHHYPNVPNLGDMTQYETWPDATIDLLVGGTPCQSFSVAGLRKGLDDPRGSLMLTYGAIARKYRPTWLVWENVPGVLSSNGGRDFGTFLGMLAELGYGFAYRVLDAQYFGLAAPRERVFVVGHYGDWRAAAAVLFERSALQGDSAPRSKARLEGARTLKSATPCGRNDDAPLIIDESGVRFATPREWERMLGFPDDYTLIPWRGKPAALCPDGPRYKALGNSMAVPVMRWIGERIAMASEIIAKARAA